jgi:hypothetical protein
MIDSFFPPAYVAVLQQVQQNLCEQFVIPQANAVISGQETRAFGVTELIQACISLIDSAEIAPDVATSNPLTTFELALGNIVACDKLANSLLTTGEFSTGGSILCNAIDSSVPA